MSGFCSLDQPALESSKTPPPTHRGTGRITVDAREKGLTVRIMHQIRAFLQGTVLNLPVEGSKSGLFLNLENFVQI